ncbi:MAG: oligosaccharide flippase family protein [Pyrinomonadaceae bacterium]
MRLIRQGLIVSRSSTLRKLLSLNSIKSIQIPSPDTELTIVIAVVSGKESLRTCLEVLTPQAASSTVEIVVPYDEWCGEVAGLADEFSSVRFLRISDCETERPNEHELYDRRRAAGLHAARGRIIAMTEDHALPSGDWCSRILEAHQRSHDVIGGAIENGIDKALNWAWYYADFGRYGRPLANGGSDYISDVNVSYKREAIMSIAAIWRDGYTETTVHWALHENGADIVLNEKILVFQNRPPVGILAAWRERIEWGRVFAESRANRQSIPQRLVYALGTLILPLLLLHRVFNNMRRQNRSVGLIARVLPVSLLLLIGWSLGEAAGDIAGPTKQQHDSPLTRKLFTNFVSLVGAEAFSKMAVFAAFAYLARMLGPANFGYVEWSVAVLMCASLFVDQGLSSYGTREIAKDPDQTSHLVNEVVIARVLLAAACSTLIVIFAVFFVRDQVVMQLLLFFGLSLLALPFLLNWVFQGHDKMNAVAVIQIVRNSIFAVLIFGLVRNSADLLFIGIAETMAVAAAAVFSLWLYRSAFRHSWRLRPTFSSKMFREGLPIGLSQMFWVVKMFGATLIVGLIATAEETGYFGAAMRILIALHAFVWLYYLNLLPTLSRAWAKDGKAFANVINGSMRIVLVVCLAGTVLWIWFSPVAATLIYGQEFSPAAGALRWLVGVIAAAAISGHYRFGLIAAGFQFQEMLTAAIGGIAAGILIPVGYFNWGINGAAAGLVSAEALVLVAAWLMARRSLFNEVVVSSSSFEGLPEASR